MVVLSFKKGPFNPRVTFAVLSGWWRGGRIAIGSSTGFGLGFPGRPKPASQGCRRISSPWSSWSSSALPTPWPLWATSFLHSPPIKIERATFWGPPVAARMYKNDRKRRNGKKRDEKKKKELERMETITPVRLWSPSLANHPGTPRSVHAGGRWTPLINLSLKPLVRFFHGNAS